MRRTVKPDLAPMGILAIVCLAEKGWLAFLSPDVTNAGGLLAKAAFSLKNMPIHPQ